MAQLKGESCDDYIEKILRQAIRLAMPKKQSLRAIINGLQPNMKMYVLRQNLTTLEEMRQAAKLAEDAEMQLMSTHIEITATLSRMEIQLQVLATAQTSTIAAFNTWERSISPFNHTRQPARRVTFADNNRPQATAAGYVQPPQQRVYTNFNPRHGHSNLQCSTPEWTERWLPSTHRAQRDHILQPDASNYNTSPMLRYSRFQNLSF